MRVTESGERRVLPADPAYMARRCEELKTICRGIILLLPKEDQALFREYGELLRTQEEMYIQCAFRSGVRAGEQRRKF